MPLSEILQDRGAIVADGGKFEAFGFKSSLRVLQLHELRFAEGSPIRRAEEKKNCALRTLQSLVGLSSAELIGLAKRRSVLADFQANRRSKGRFVRWHFLFGRNRKGNQNQQKKDTPDLHISLRIRFCLLPEHAHPRLHQLGQEPPKWALDVWRLLLGCGRVYQHGREL